MTRRLHTRVFGVVVGLPAVIAAACGDPEPPFPRIPVLASPPPLPAAALAPLPAPFRFTITDLRATAGSGAELDLPRVEAVVEIPSPADLGDRARVRIVTLRLVEPRVTLSGGATDSAAAGIDFYARILEPRLRIDELIVDDGAVGMLAARREAPGRWRWRVRGLDLRARDIRLGGERGEAEGLEIVRASGLGEVDGRPLPIADARIGVERTAAAIVADGALHLGVTRLRARLFVDRRSAWRARIAADTFAFAELRAVFPELPPEGGGQGVVAVRGRAGVEAIDVARLDLAAGESRVALRGTFLPGGDPGFREVLVEAAPLRTADLARVLDVAVPGDGAWSGWLAGDGTARGGIDLRGALAYEPDEGATSRLTLGGRIFAAPWLRLDLAVDGRPLRAADTAFDVALRLRGPADALGVRGTVAVRGVDDATATLDVVLRTEGGVPPVVSGRAVVRTDPAFFDGADGGRPAPPILVRADGHAVLAAGGALSVRIVTDELPLARAPWPEPVDSVRGVFGGVVIVGGTVDRPTVRGRFDLRRGGALLEPLGVTIDALQGSIFLDDGRLTIGRITARAGGGSLSLAGGVRLFGGARRLDLRLHVDSVRVAPNADAEVTLSADLALAGSFAAPRLSGRVYDASGWIREDIFRKRGGLDLEHPPYAELARAAPWPAESRLRGAEPEPPLPVRGEVEVEVGPELHVIDEDSDLFGAGRLWVIAEEDGWTARGLLEVWGGFYAFFGERFRVYGGAVGFAEDGFDPRVAIVAEQEDGRAIAAGLQETTTAPERFPPLEFRAIGRPDSLREELVRWSLLPERRDQLVELLFFGAEPQPVTGWRSPRFWLADDPATLIDQRAESRAVPLFWSYLADEAYDFVPLSRGWLRAGVITVASRYPARLVVGPLVAAGAVLDPDLELWATQPFEAGVFPGFRALYRIGGGGTVELFTEPRFYVGTIGGRGHPGFFTRRRTGIGIRWTREY